jgi:hypothetical protein
MLMERMVFLLVVAMVEVDVDVVTTSAREGRK